MDTLTGKILKLNGWPDGKIIGLAKACAVNSAAQGLARECLRLLPKAEERSELRESPLPYPIWGREAIDEGSLAQMDNAMRLPVSVAGALMPDAHLGFDFRIFNPPGPAIQWLTS